jgi:FKBP-type peptidyl-prolyl cis-trans isomerase FkpA
MNVIKFILAFSIILINIDLAFAESKISQKELKLEKIITTLVIKDNVLGNGRQAEKGLAVTVHYIGWLYDPNQKDGKGKKFDSSLDRNDPFVFNLGGGQVIRGWDDGVDGMKIHGKRTLIIPPEMGYGSRGAGGVIPPNATLIFDIELLGVK